jgi:hypothetical protein
LGVSVQNLNSWVDVLVFTSFYLELGIWSDVILYKSQKKCNRVHGNDPDSQFRMHANVRRLHPELWRQKNWLLLRDNAPAHTFFFNREFLTKNNMTIISHPPYFFLFLQFKIKLKGSHFDTIEVIEAEWQAMLNTLREHNFKVHLKKWKKCWEQWIHAEGDYFEGDGGQ